PADPEFLRHDGPDDDPTQLDMQCASATAGRRPGHSARQGYRGLEGPRRYQDDRQHRLLRRRTELRHEDHPDYEGQGMNAGAIKQEGLREAIAGASHLRVYLEKLPEE